MKTLLLAGCTSGIGLETLKALRAEGHRVVAAVRDRAPLTAFEGLEVVDFEAENSQPEIGGLPEKIDGLVYFPGTITLKSFRALKDSDFQKDLEVNLLGAVRLIRAALPALQKVESASIVLFSTVAAETGMPFHSSIAAAKGAVVGFGRSLAAELAPKIRVNCVAPSLTRTPLAAGLIDTDAKMEASRQGHPLKRIGDPAEVAQLASFLLSDASRFITGQVIGIDGGLSTLRLV